MTKKVRTKTLPETLRAKLPEIRQKNLAKRGLFFVLHETLANTTVVLSRLPAASAARPSTLVRVRGQAWRRS